MLKKKFKNFNMFLNFPSQVFFWEYISEKFNISLKNIINVKLVMVSMVYINVGWVFDFSNINWLLVSSILEFQTTFETL
jgi:hypothetical protein